MQNIPKADPPRSRAPGDAAADARRLRELLLAASRRRSLRDPIAATCEATQLTPAQIHALAWLGHDGALTMGELARRIGITEKTITGVVDRLEHGGYLARVRDEADRRVVRVKLTETGVAQYRLIDSHIQEKLGGLMSLLDPADRRALLRIFEKLLQRLGDAPAAPDRSRQGSP
jgi:DNA-binding MarR family transcriptional regulator